MARHTSLIGIFLLIAACASPAPGPSAPKSSVATESSKQLEATPLLATPVDNFDVRGASKSIVTEALVVEGLPERALRIKILQPLKEAADVALAAATSAAIRSGDALLLTVYVRAVESDEARLRVLVKSDRQPYRALLDHSVRARAEWKKFELPFQAPHGYPAGDVELILQLGFGPQTIEVGGLQLESFGQVPLARLPRTQILYAGSEANAAWRELALERIERVRKGKLSVSVVDSDGQPVAGAAVSVAMKRQAFLFGSSLNPKYFRRYPDELEATVYLKHFVKLLNTGMAGALSWPALGGQWGPGYSLRDSIATVDWMHQNDLLVRGHALIWPGWQQVPERLRDLESNPEELRQVVTNHIRKVVTALRGRVDHWDVVNEAYVHDGLLEVLGEREMIQWFKYAQAVDPDAKLYYNDAGILTGGGGETAHRDHYERTIGMLLSGDAPLHGLAMHGHFSAAPTAPEDVLEILDRFAVFEKPVLITDYDVTTNDEDLAGRYTRDLLIALYSHARVEGLILSSIWDAADKNGLIFRDDFSLKPAGAAFRELVLGRWWTREEGRSDATGLFELRGYHGDYDIVVNHRGKTRAVGAAIHGEAASVTIIL